jgi:hypothetical protein
MILGSLLGGCGLVRVETGGTSPSSSEEGSSAREREPRDSGESLHERMDFHETASELDRSLAAIDRGDFQRAVDLARSGRATLKRESEAYGISEGASGPGQSVRSAHARWHDRSVVLEGLGYRGMGRDVESVIALGEDGFSLEPCRDDFVPRCKEHNEKFLPRSNEHAAYLTKTFPNLVVNDTGRVHPKSFHEFTLDSDLDTTGMGMLNREVRRAKGWVGIRIQPTAKKSAGPDIASLLVEGSTSTMNFEECNRTGTARIGGVDFDVERCHKSPTTFHRADLAVEVPENDAAAIDVAKGETLFVVFDVKNWQGSGARWRVRSARIAYAKPPRKRD